MSVIGSAAQLVVEFVGDERVLDPDEELTFGRAADLVIDENRYLHRVLGRFSYAKGTWWLTNVGSAIPLTVSDVAGPSLKIENSWWKPPEIGVEVMVTCSA